MGSSEDSNTIRDKLEGDFVGRELCIVDGAVKAVATLIAISGGFVGWKLFCFA